MRSEKDEHNGQDIRVTDRRRIYLDHEREPADEAVEEPSLKPSYVEELEARTKAAEDHARDVQNRFEQVRAQLQRETDETRQRLNRAADERAERENANFIAALLPVLDNLKRAMDAGDNASAADVLEGVRRTAESFERALLSAGVEPVESIGQPFDPELHEAVETTPSNPENDGKIVSEYSRGYKMGDRLLRPARVAVGRSSRSGKKSESAHHR